MSNQNPPRTPSGVDPEIDHIDLNAPPESPFQDHDPPRPLSGERGPNRIYRNTNDKVVGGVCGGLGVAVGVDPVWFRLGFIFLTLSSGIGLLLYLMAWILIPEPPDGVAPVAGQSTNSAVAFGIFLLAVGSALFVDALVPWFDRVAWPIAVIGLGIGLVVFGTRERQR